MRSQSPIELSNKMDDLPILTRTQIPFEVPDFVAQDCINATDADDILILSQRNKKQELVKLYRRYYNQIQYGCKNVHCTTPTCLSFRRRHARAPLRPYTDLTARALACQLLSERDPEAALCRNEPCLVNDSDAQLKMKIAQYGRRPKSQPREPDSVPYTNGHVEFPRLNAKRKYHPLSNGHLETVDPGTLDSRRSGSPEMVLQRSESAPVVEETQGNPQAQPKDRKSFTQMLFDNIVFAFFNFAKPRRPSAETVEDDSVSDDMEDAHDVHSSDTSSQSSEQATKLSINQQSPGQRQNSDQAIETKDDSNAHLYLQNNQEAPQTEEVSNDEHHTPSVQTASNIDDGILSDYTTRFDRANADRETSKPNWQDISTDRQEQIPVDISSGSVVTSLSSCYTNSPACPECSTTLENLSKETSDWLISVKDNPRYFYFIAQSIFYNLRKPDRILSMVFNWTESSAVDFTTGAPAKLDRDVLWDLVHCLRRLAAPCRIFGAVFEALSPGFQPPPSLRLSRQNNLSQKSSNSDKDVDSLRPTFVDDQRLACVCAIVLHALAQYVVPSKVRPLRSEFTLFEDSALAFPTSFIERKRLRSLFAEKSIVGIADKFEDWNANRLFERVMELVNIRIAFAEIAQTWKPASLLLHKIDHKKPNFAELVANHLEMGQRVNDSGEYYANIPAILTIAWCRNLFSRNWNGRAIVTRKSALGGSLQLLATMYRNRSNLSLLPDQFYMDLLSERLSTMEMPVEWLAFKPNNRELHLLAFSFLFRPSTLVEYFRAINFSIMAKANVAAQIVSRDVANFLDVSTIPVYGITDMLHVMQPHMAKHLVLTVRRDNVLIDAIDQIWRRQRCELMRPLKVLIGQDEGEQGVDHGGVQQEFFRVLFAQALDPDYGMFTIDERTRMTWFRPGSLEPLYKYEVLGVLTSIAVYNFITLPITFPLAFYRKLLGLKVKKLVHIEDGWPDLANGMQQMLNWSDGDVADVFVRTYEFVYDAFGTTVNVDMEKVGRDSLWPPPERKKGKEREKSATFELPLTPDLTPYERLSPAGSPSLTPSLSPDLPNKVKGTSTPSSAESDALDADADPSLVTNATRDQFVKDYIFWLTDKSVRPQFEAFSRGFHTCLDRTALSIFSPEALKQVIEGQNPDTPVDIEELQQHTLYEDGYTAESATVRDFWDVVRNFSPAQHRQLLEFVTASDRVPVTGLRSVAFIVQRNGVGDDRLPTSMTCFGRLLLPEYSSRQVLEQKLTKAIENSKGFGVA